MADEQKDSIQAEKTADPRLKIMYLYQILMTETDEDHILTMPQIIAKLEERGIKASRKALYQDIKALQQFGVDIDGGRGANSGYRVLSRDFQLPELKLLADAVSAARFLTKKKSEELLAKIGTLASVHEAKDLRRIHVSESYKGFNERIYLSMDEISRAISAGRQITFKYFRYDRHKKKDYGDGERVCSPIALTWSEERYYLVAYYEKYHEIANFRVDRMENVRMREEKAIEPPKGFKLARYLSESFSMFSGATTEVTLRFTNDLVNAVIDRFGTDVPILPEGEGHFNIHVHVKAEKPFFGWIFGFGGNAEIISPPIVRETYRDTLAEVLALHQGEPESMI